MDVSKEVTYRVNSFRVPCVGVAPMNCLQVQRGDEATGDWQNFYWHIEGFAYEPGYLYRLLVRETPLPPEQVPEDASAIRYELVELIDKTPDPRLAIHDIWVLRRLDGNSVDDFDRASRTERPYLEFNVSRGEYLGNDGCNAIRGDLLTIGPQALRLGPASAVGVARPCGDGELQARLLAALERVAAWRRDGTGLALLDENGVEVMAFRKTD
jgi:heat shock protein HslJ